MQTANYKTSNVCMQNKYNANWQTLFRISHRLYMFSYNVTPTASKVRNILVIKGCNKSLKTTKNDPLQMLTVLKKS